jgi:DNA-directed RNA polymerase I, II, and III subunit RPABC2
MSDDEYSDNNYESDNSDSEEETTTKSKKYASFKPISKNIQSLDDDNSDEEEQEEPDEDQKGGEDDIEYNSDEDGSKEEDESVVNSDVDDDDISVDPDLNENEEPQQKSANKTKKQVPIVDDDDDDDDEYDENYLQKFDSEITKNYVNEFHPECLIQNYDEIAKLCKVVRDSDGIIIDTLHKTIPYLTKYEKARILGQRAKQIESGAKPFVNIPETIIDGYIIAELELKEKKIPFIIRRPIPGGGCEYWHLRDLEIISF